MRSHTLSAYRCPKLKTELTLHPQTVDAQDHVISGWLENVRG